MRQYLSLLLSLTFFVGGSFSSYVAAEIALGETLPSFNMEGLNGPSRNLDEFRGTPLIINVWASWCGPCRAEMASLERLAWTPGIGAFNVVGISTDDFRDKASAWLVDSNATILHFIDRKLILETAFGASRIPLTLFFDAEGRLVKKVYGARRWDSSESLLLVRSLVAGGIQ